MATSQQSAFGPFPTGRKGLVERSSLIRHTTAHLHPQKGKTDIKMLQKFSGAQGMSMTSAENQSFIAEVCQSLSLPNFQYKNAKESFT